MPESRSLKRSLLEESLSLVDLPGPLVARRKKWPIVFWHLKCVIRVKIFIYAYISKEIKAYPKKYLHILRLVSFGNLQVA